MDQTETRQAIRKQRRALDADVRTAASGRICDVIAGLADFRVAQKMAAFLAFDGEVDLTALISTAWDQGKQVFLPIVVGKGQPLTFAGYDCDTQMSENRFGIRQPDITQATLIDPRELDLVLTPLVAFDADGHRIGVGGGFYDRTFAFRQTSEIERPTLIGVAFELQRVEAIVPEAWDVQLDAVVTEDSGRVTR